MGSISDRLEQIRIILGLKKHEMADVMGITRTYYSNILAGKGHSNLRIEHLEALLEKHSVNPAWIITGHGETFLEKGVEKTEWIAGHLVPDIPVTARIDEELLKYFVKEVIRESKMPIVPPDLAYSLCLRFGRYYIHKNKDATQDNLDIPSLTASFLALLQTVQSMVTATFELLPGDKVVVHFEGRHYSFRRYARPAK